MLMQICPAGCERKKKEKERNSSALIFHISLQDKMEMDPSTASGRTGGLTHSTERRRKCCQRGTNWGKRDTCFNRKNDHIEVRRKRCQGDQLAREDTAARVTRRGRACVLATVRTCARVRQRAEAVTASTAAAAAAVAATATAAAAASSGKNYRRTEQCMSAVTHTS